MHGQKMTYFWAFACDTTDQAFWETSQVKAVYHVQSRHCTLDEKVLAWEWNFSEQVDILWAEILVHILKCNTWVGGLSTRELPAISAGAILETARLMG